MKRKRSGSEVSNWWFSDEELQDAISNIIDVPPKLRKPQKPALRDLRDNAQNETGVTSGTTQV